MVKLRFGIPLFFLLLHQYLSNSWMGLNNSLIGISAYLSFIFAMCLFLILNKNIGIIKYFSIFLLMFFISLWLVFPSKYKDLSSLFINLFITFYIVSQGGFYYVKKQLAILVGVSAFLSVIQISGVTPIVHVFNSQYLEERAGQTIQKIEVKNILWNKNEDDFDSRQVRAPGIFHSSALLGGIFVMYITFAFCGFYNSIKSYAFIPFLCVFGGSKLVLLSALLILIISLLFRRISLRSLIVLIISSFICVALHKWLFNSLLDYQFNLDMLFFSIDVRISQYSWESIDFASFLPTISLFGVPLLSIFILNSFLHFLPSSDKIFYFIVVSIAVLASFFSTPHIANMLFGWFYFPVFFCYKYFLKRDNLNAIKFNNLK